MISPLALPDLTAQHHAELRKLATECRRPSAHWLPRWHVSWTRTRLSPAERHAGDSLVIIISATRVA
jgi:hypothetical protein